MPQWPAGVGRRVRARPAPGPAPAGPSGKAAAPSPFTDYTSERPGKRIKITAERSAAAEPRPARPTTRRRSVSGPRTPGRRRPPVSRCELYADGLAEPAADPHRAQRRRVRGGERRRRGARRSAACARRQGRAGRACSRRGSSSRSASRSIRRAASRAGSTSPTPTPSCGFPYRSGDLEARGPAETIVPSSPAAGGCAAAATGPATSCSRGTARRCSCRSARARTTTIPTTTPAEKDRARRSSSSRPTAAAGASTPPASATRSASPSIPRTGELWASVNERDELGDNLVPDYITQRQGGRLLRLALVLHRRQPGSAPPGQAPRAEGQGDRARRAAAGAHRLAADDRSTRASSSPPSTAGDIFAAQHGSWNRARAPATRSSACRCAARTARRANTRIFLTGFVTADGDVWGRPVGVDGRERRRAAGHRRRLEFDLAGQLSGRRRQALTPSPARRQGAVRERVDLRGRQRAVVDRELVEPALEVLGDRRVMLSKMPPTLMP